MAGSSVLTLEDPRWRAFVERCPDATPFHDPAWSRLLADCYGFEALVVAIERDAELAAGLPVLVVRSLRGRTRLTALPFTDALAPLGDPGLVSDLVSALLDVQAARGARASEVRAAVPGGVQTVRGTVHVLSLGPDPDAVRKTFHRSQVQRGIARAEREGVSVRVAAHPDDLLTVFYELHLATRRRQGVPIQPRRFFELLWERVLSPGGGELLIAEVGGRAVAAAVFLQRNGRLLYKLGASDTAAWPVRPNHAVFWEAVRRGCAGGAVELDFGRTEPGHEGLRAFKAGWGTVERPLVYTTFGAEPRPGSGRAHRALAAVIRRTPPGVCRMVGERLYRYAA